MKTAAVALISVLAAYAELPANAVIDRHVAQENLRRASLGEYSVTTHDHLNANRRSAGDGGLGNRTFELSGKETVRGRDVYEFVVTPTIDEKYLTRGRVWIDAQNYAVI